MPTTLVTELHESKKPFNTTEHERISAYSIDDTAEENMQRQIAILKGISLGEKAISEGKIASHDEAKKRFGKWRR
jgi:predicted transcriptional regulator